MPTLLTQSGISGRQFAHILIRVSRKNYNQFPDIERTADDIGKRKFPIRDSDIFKIVKKVGLKLNGLIGSHLSQKMIMELKSTQSSIFLR